MKGSGSAPEDRGAARRFFRRLIVRGVILLLFGYVLVLGGAYVFQRKLTYFPESLPPGANVLEGRDEDLQEVSIPTGDGFEIHGVYRPPPEGALTVLYLHGNAGHLARRLDHFERILALGVGGLIIDYRGFGKSPGSPTEEGLYRDASASLAWLARRDVRPGSVVLFGKSLGTGVAVETARDHPVAGVVLESPYTSIPAVGAHRFPFLPVRLLMHDRFDAASGAREIRCPVLAIWSASDRVVPADLSEDLFALLPGPKEKLVVSSAHHIDIAGAAGPIYWERWKTFLAGLRR